ISSGTGLAGAVMDDGKQEKIKQRQALDEERKKLVEETATAAPGAQADAAANLRLAELQTQLAKLPVAKKSQGLIDILCDETGVSFHRLQVVIWTLVLTLIFVFSVYRRLDMPDFDNQLLALMGISNGTYLGFKLPEKQA